MQNLLIYLSIQVIAHVYFLVLSVYHLSIYLFRLLHSHIERTSPINRGDTDTKEKNILLKILGGQQTTDTLSIHKTLGSNSGKEFMLGIVHSLR